MEIFFYIVIFIIGTLFGSFYTLAVYRIPKRQDIIYTHSYCPNCNHKLGLLDLFPIFSYIFLGGKCRYCKQKIRPRYLILETLSGTLFVVIAYLVGLRIEDLTKTQIINYCFVVLYITYIILIAGIDQENKNIDKLVNIYGVVISLVYMLYLYIVGEISIYRYGIYICLYVAMFIISAITFKKISKNTYLNGIVVMILIMASFTGEFITSISLATALVAMAIYILITKLKLRKANIKKEINKKEKEQISNQMSIGFWLCSSNILILILALTYLNLNI